MKKDLKISFWADTDKGGVYDVLGSFGAAFSKALSKVVEIVPIKDVLEGTPVNAMFSFNSTGYEQWSKAMNSNVKNVIWSVDSFFYNNFYLYDRFSVNPNFVLLDIVPSDKSPIAFYAPSFKHCNYFPHATDFDFWKYKESKKEHDVVFFGSIIDLESRIEEMSQKYPKELLDIIFEMKETSLSYPEQPFWNLYLSAQKCYGLELEKPVFHEIFLDLADVCEAQQRINMVKSLSKFNVEVFGNGPWEKYISGNVKYRGALNVVDTVDVMNKSKISLHIQPMKLSGGLHERFLNASAVKTFTLMGINPWIEKDFGDAFGYFDCSNFADIEDVLSDYLNNEEKRIAQVDKAYDIVKNKHTWDNRASDFVNLFK